VAGILPLQSGVAFTILKRILPHLFMLFAVFGSLLAAYFHKAMGQEETGEDRCSNFPVFRVSLALLNLGLPFIRVLAAGSPMKDERAENLQCSFRGRPDGQP